MSLPGDPRRRPSEPPPRAPVIDGGPARQARLPPKPPGPRGLRVVLRSKYLVLRWDLTRRLVLLTRLSAPYESIDALKDTFAELHRATADLNTARMSIFIDSRAAPPRNDPEFEAEFSKLRAGLFKQYRRVGLLMQTAIGVLHSTRHAQMDGVEVFVTVDPRALAAHLEVELDDAEIDVAL